MDTESTKINTGDLGSTLENRSREKVRVAIVPIQDTGDPITERGQETNKEIPDADITDDEQTKRSPFFRSAEHIEYWVRRNQMDDRRKERDKQRRQHSRYLLNLDDRLNFLEEEVLRLRKAGGLKEDPKNKEPQSAIPKLKPMTWAEYEIEKGKPIPSVHYAIDMLVEEPVLFGGWNSIDPNSTNSENPVIEEQTSSNDDMIGPQIKSMPERIRINSKELREALGKIADRGTFDVRPDHPVIMRRPFKFLLMHEGRIKTLLSQEAEALQALQATKDKSPCEEVPVVANEEPPKSPDKVESDLSHNIIAAENRGLSNKKEEASSGGSKEKNDGVVDAERILRITKENLVKCLALLISFIEEYVKPTKQRVSSQTRVSFDEIYFLFEPGQLVYVSKDDEQPQKVWRVTQVTGSNRFLRPYNPFDPGELVFRSARKDTHSPLTIDCYSLAFDGLHFRQVYKRFEIPCFTETQLVKRLPVVPYELAKRLLPIPEDLMSYRSQQFLECTKISHRFYQGRTVDKDSQGRALSLNIKGEYGEQPLFAEEIVGNIMIDMEKAFQRNPSWMPDFRELEEYKVNPREREPDKDKQREEVQQDYAIDTRRKEDYLEEEARTGKLESWKIGMVDIPDMLLLPDRVPAYFLRARKWGKIANHPGSNCL